MKKTLVWAHRGASAYAPENTLAAFQAAVDMGADGVELDVQMSKDGELVVVHDEELGRVSGVSGWVKDFTFAELQKLDVNKHFPKYGPQRIPALKEVYELLQPTGLTVNVEIKSNVIAYPDIEKKVLDLTKQMGMQAQAVYSSFNHYSIRDIRRMDAQAVTGMLYQDRMIGAMEYAKDIVKANALHPALYHVTDPDFFTECRRNQLSVHVWTVNDEKAIRYLCEHQVEAVITNDPKLARAVVDEYEDGKLTPGLVKKLEKVL